MKGLKSTLIISVLFVGLTACGHGSTSYSILQDSQSFKQNSAQQNTKIDVLWVIDNSGSMASSQANLANNFPAFIHNFTEKAYDFQVAVTTTQAYLANDIWAPYYNSTPTPSFYEGQAQDMIAKFRDGEGSNHSGFFILDPSTPDLAANFVINATQGTNGSGDERSLQSMETALLSPHNEGFVRDGAFLAVIILTDEDDFSNDTTHHYESYDKPLVPIDHYVSFLDGLTNSSGATRRYNVNTIAVPDQTCLDQINNGGGQKIGVRVNQMADATGGVKGNICGDFANELNLISNQIVQLSTQFYLGEAKPVPSSIVVHVDGVLVPNADTNPNHDGGWTYNADANSLVFSGSYVPQQSAAINVAFDPETLTF
jgi:hypothetical protein